MPRPRPRLRLPPVLLLLAACGGDAGPPPIEAELWTLGHDLGSAVVFNSYAKPDQARARFAAATASASKLGIAAPGALPEPGTTKEEGDDRLSSYLQTHALIFAGAGGEVAKRHGEPRAALVLLAIRTLAVAVQVSPEYPSIGIVLGVELAELGGKAGLPPDLLAPLVEKARSGASGREVQDAVNALHEAMPKKLGEAVRAGRLAGGPPTAAR